MVENASIQLNSDGRRSYFRPWSELIPDTLGLIFSNLEAQEILQVIPLVCKSWCRVVEGPYCWQRINIGEFDNVLFPMGKKVEQLLRALIPRSSGSLRELSVSCIDDDMLSFIAEHAGSLQTLKIFDSGITDSGLEQFATQSTSLTTLVVRNYRGTTMPSLEAIMRNCKTLVSLTCGDYSVLMLEKPFDDEDESAMLNLKRLDLHYSLTNDSFVLGLLSRCPKLEWVKIRGIYGLRLDPRIVKEKYPNIVTLDIGDGLRLLRLWVCRLLDLVCWSGD